MNASNRAEWLALRKTGIGGSDIAAIMGLSPWKTAVDVFLDKTSQAPDQEENEAMYWGTVLEDVVATEYTSRTGTRVQRINTMMRHPERRWMLANIDRAIVSPGSRARFDEKTGALLGADGVLECKTASAYKAADWGTECDQDAVPTHYAAQCMWYLAITGLEWCDIAVLIGGQRYISKRIERDQGVIDAMVAQSEEFWNKYVLEGIAPEPVTGSDAAKLFQADAGTTIEANPKTLELLARAKELKEQIATLELELDGDPKKGINGVTGQIKAWMKDAATISLAGNTLATWKKSADSQITDWKSVAQALTPSPNLIAANTTTRAGSRRFIIK